MNMNDNNQGVSYFSFLYSMLFFYRQICNIFLVYGYFSHIRGFSAVLLTRSAAVVAAPLLPLPSLVAIEPAWVYCCRPAAYVGLEAAGHLDRVSVRSVGR